MSNTTYDFAPVVDHDFLISSPSEIIFGNSSRTSMAREFFASVDIIVGANSREAMPYFTYRWQAELGLKEMNFTVDKVLFKDQIIPSIVNETIDTNDEETKHLLEELLYFTYTDWSNPNGTDVIRRNAIDIYSDIFFLAGTIRLVEGHVALSRGRTYMYEFGFDIETHPFMTSWTKGWIHGEELAFIFGAVLFDNSDWIGNTFKYTTEEKQISKTLMTLWTNFAKTGQPTSPTLTSVRWPEFTAISRDYLKTSQSALYEIVQQYHPRRMWLWNEYIPSVLSLSQVSRQHVETKPSTPIPVDETFVG
ncbi:hypothetical protein ACF0H5_015833 [Mactra antiquata]